MADKRQNYATLTFRKMGFYTYKSVDAIPFKKKEPVANPKRIIAPQDKGRADMEVVGRGLNGIALAKFVEVKNGQSSNPSAFKMSLWTENQRGWAKHMEENFGAEYYVFLVLGHDKPNLKPVFDPITDSRRPKRAWLVPYKEMEKAFSYVSIYQDTFWDYAIPGSGRKKELHELQLDAHHLLEEWHCPWGKGGFVIPKCHPFLDGYDLTPVLKRAL